MYTFMNAAEARAKTMENREIKQNQIIEDEMTQLVGPCIETAIEQGRTSCLLNPSKVNCYTREFLAQNGYTVTVNGDTVAIAW